MHRNFQLRLSTLLVVLLVFGAGVLIGYALDRGIAQAAPADPVEEVAKEEVEERRGWIIERVDLRPDQRVRIDSILVFYQEQMKELQQEFHEAYRPRSRELVISTRNAIKELLDERQRAAYDSLLSVRNR